MNHENFEELRQNSNNMETALQPIRSCRQARTWTEASTEVFTNVGYVALEIISLYSLYKIGFYILHGFSIRGVILMSPLFWQLS